MGKFRFRPIPMPSLNFRAKPLVFALLASVLACRAPAAEPTPKKQELIPVEGTMVAQASRSLRLAGLPPLPPMALEYDCYAWSGLSAGIYATFTLEKTGFESWLASLPADLEKTMPIPSRLYAPPNSSAPWLSPPHTPESYVLGRGRISRGAPELLRVYVDPQEFKIQLYYSWNNRRTYP